MKDTTSETIKVLSVKQPYVSWIMEGIKTLEIRTWKTKYRGRLYIHSCKKLAYDYGRYVYKCGYILGHVELVDIRPMHIVDEVEACTPFVKKSWAWVLRNPCYFIDSIPAKGQQRIWNYKFV